MEHLNEIWLNIEEVCSLTGEIRETVRRKCKSGKYTSKHSRVGKSKIYSILLSSLKKEFQNKYFNKKQVNDFSLEVSCREYANITGNKKAMVDKYLQVLTLTAGMKHSEIIEFLDDWNEKHPNKKICYTSLYNAKKKFDSFGVAGLITERKVSPENVFNDDYYQYYKSLYLREGAPSVSFCWRTTLGYAIQKDKVDVATFPSARTFDRHLRAEIPQQAIYLARYGTSAWNKKYASYIDRDYSNLRAGSCWVSDHAQIDVAVNFNGTVCFPWVTVFRDVKSSKWLGWFLHSESPNSDHIFQAFYYGVIRYGLPDDILLDNGKDYRCKDFAGGRSNSVKVKHNQDNEISLMKHINVTPHFALPYNAQTKPVERDFLKIKTYLSKGFVGYRGGKITERPEKLKDEIKSNKICSYDEFKALFDDFIINVLNKMPSKGKVLQGRCPDEVWAEEFQTKKVITKDALKLFCMRTTNNISIGRNGIYDSSLQLNYWNEWMITEKGRKVYIRRDVNAYQEAWVFDAKTDKYLGKANVYKLTSFLATTNIQKVEYRNALEQKNREKKILKAFIKSKHNPTNADIVANLKTTLLQNDFVAAPVISEIKNTQMDKVILQDKKSKEKQPQYVSPLTLPKKLYLSEAERDRDLAKKAM